MIPGDACPKNKNKKIRKMGPQNDGWMERYYKTFASPGKP